MNIRVYQNWQLASRKAADAIGDLVNKKPDASICFATGNTPKLLYSELVKDVHEGKLSLAHIRAFTLDETSFLSKEGRTMFLQFMYEHLYGPVHLKPDQIDALNTNAPDLEEECRRYQDSIRSAGGFDLVILGIGMNGHLAYNEPGSARTTRVRVVELEQSTAAITASYFGNSHQPTWGMSVGIADIMEARKLLVLANGRSKAQIVRKALEGCITAEVPASFIQEHQSAEVFLDDEAAANMT